MVWGNNNRDKSVVRSMSWNADEHILIVYNGGSVTVVSVGGNALIAHRTKIDMHTHTYIFYMPMCFFK